MKRIQQGSPEYDMKKAFPYGRKSRVSKRGRPYLIVPFAWHTPNSEGGARARGEGIARAEYGWGDRLKAEGNIGGLVVMNGKKHTAFTTFRVISVDSPKSSWIRKEVPANDVAAAVARATSSAVKEAIEKGLKADFGVE